MGLPFETMTFLRPRGPFIDSTAVASAAAQVKLEVPGGVPVAQELLQLRHAAVAPVEADPSLYG